MTHRISLSTIAALLVWTAGCSDYGAALDPYADMDQGITDDTQHDMPASIPDQGTTRPDMPAPVPDMPTMQELAAPQELQAIAEPTGITLTWLPVRDALRYEVRINGGAWQNNGVQMQFVHEDAPGGSITDATIDASDMTERPHVTLEASDLITEAGPEQTYEVRAIHPDGASPPSEPTTARRPFEVDTVTWERQNIGDETWHPLPDTTIGLTTLDDTAAPEGTTHTYRAIITPIAGAPFTSPTDTGARLAAIQVSVGSLHACALLNNGEVRCWGDNGLGQLGTGDTTQLPQDAANYRIPTAKLPAKAVDISAGVTSTCVLADNSNLYCWGSFDNNLLPYDESTGQKQIAPLNPSDTLVKSIPDNHHQHICFVTQNDNVRCFWRNGHGQCGAEVENLYLAASLLVDVDLNNEPVQHVSQSFHHTCAHLTNGQVMCWGSNYWNQNIRTTIGKEVGDMPPPLLNINGIGDIQKVFGGGLFNGCFMNNGNRYRCWGAGTENGLIGDGQNQNTSPPGERPVILQDIAFRPSHISIGGSNICVLSDVNEVYCWGDGSTGINGNGSTETIGDDSSDRISQPIRLGGSADSLSVSPTKSVCAVVTGEAICWGNNTRQILGIPTLTASETIGDEPGEMPPQPVQLW